MYCKNMHPLLIDFSIFTWRSILESEEKVIVFLTDVGLIPNRDLELKCVKCGSSMVGWSDNSRKVGFRFVCSNKKKTKCSGAMDPLCNTFFEKTRVPFQDILAIIFCFALQLPGSFCYKQLCDWRKSRKEQPIHPGTFKDYFSHCREVCEVIASHNYEKLGGLGKKIFVDQTFLAHRKYNKGRICETSSVVVFGIYCNEDKEGLFLEAEGKKKKDIWPYIKYFCDPKTNVFHSNEICKKSVHKTADDSGGKFSKNDKNNIMNNLEKKNEKQKRDLKSKRPKNSFYQVMGVYFYRRIRLGNLKTDGEKVLQFLNDIKSVYPGPGRDGVKMKKLEEIIVESKGMQHLETDYNKESSGSQEFNVSDSEDEIEDMKEPNWSDL